MPSSSEELGPRLERYRNFLRLQARLQLHRLLQSKLDASDVVQETYARAVQGWAQYRGQSDAEFGAWLQEILYNVLLDLARRYGAARRDVAREQPLETLLAESSLRLGALLAGNEASPSQQVVRKEEWLRLADAVEQLPEAERDAFVLHHLLDCSVEEVATRLGRTGAGAASLLQRALKRLRGCLRENHSE
jgi:RNA polymerase sigma-70 factor (ECF subfamily)